MKRILSFLSALLMLCSVACAEDTGIAVTEYNENVSYIMNRIEAVRQTIEAYATATQDEDTLIYYGIMRDHAVLANVALHAIMETAASETLPEGMEHLPEESTYLLNENTLSSDWRYLEDYAVFASCDVYWTTNHLRETLTAHKEDGTLVGIYEIEYAQRDDAQTILLFKGYNALFGTTTRCAVRATETGYEPIFTETLGKTWDIMLDVDGWMNGIEPETWTKALLYSREEGES